MQSFSLAKSKYSIKTNNIVCVYLKKKKDLYYNRQLLKCRTHSAPYPNLSMEGFEPSSNRVGVCHSSTELHAPVRFFKYLLYILNQKDLE